MAHKGFTEDPDFAMEWGDDFSEDDVSDREVEMNWRSIGDILPGLLAEIIKEEE